MKPIVALLAISVLCGTLTVRGASGKITGVIKDKKTGEALIGANVRLENTRLGAVTDLDGRYVILNVPASDYTIIASMVGYRQYRTTGVRVNIDLTTTIDIEMSEEAIETSEVVVIAERPLVQKDLTAKTAIVSGKDISAMPVSEVSSVLTLQAGFVAGSLRGGRSGEVAYWIDGVPVTDAFNGTQVVEINKSLIQELQLVSGAFNAEYGQAMSGIVNIATKEGGIKYTGGVGIYGGDYLSFNKELFPGNQFNPTNIRNIEANLSGPIFGDDLTFFANARYIYFNGYLKAFNRFNPSNISYTDSLGVFHLFRDQSGKGDSSTVPMNWSERYYAQGKLTWRIASLMKLSANYIFDYTKAKPFNRSYFYNPEGMGNNYNQSHTVIFQFSHSVTPSTFYTIGGSYFLKDFKYYLYDLQYADSISPTGQFMGQYEVVNPNGPRYVHPLLFISNDSYSFLTGGTDLSKFHRSTQTALIKADVTSQIDGMNLLKAGIEFRTHMMEYENIQLQPIQSQTDLNVATGDPYIRTRILDISSNSHDYYKRKPREFSAYIQDKMEFKNIIVNIGVRYDYFQPDGQILSDPSDPSIYNPIKPQNRFHDQNRNGNQDPGETEVTLAERESYWFKSASPKSAVSPRLGVSFPITDRGIVHFSYGHFFQIPRFERLYENPRFKIGLGTGNQGIIGNADLQPEQTISGELGVQQQLTDDISVDVTTYLRDIRNLTSTRGDEIIIFGGASKYSRYTNADFGFVKGIVLTLEKRFSNGFNSTVDYTYQVARGSASDPQESRNALTSGALPEVQLLPLGWDQRHTLNVVLSYSTASWGLNMIASYGSGTPYTPRSSTDISTILTNSQLKQSFFNVDLRGYYEVQLASMKMVFFTRINNLFDIRNEYGVFDDTGRAGFTSDESRARLTNPKEYINTLTEWFRIPTFYSEPRRVELGMNLEF
ncbi:MAG: TonB-dependent receptor [bacterium]